MPFCTSIVELPALSGLTCDVPNVVSLNTFTLVGVTGVVPVPPDSVNSALVVSICKNLPGNKCFITLTWSDAIVIFTASSSFVPGLWFSKSADTLPKILCG